jgi:IPT/TIG domain
MGVVFCRALSIFKSEAFVPGGRSAMPEKKETYPGGIQSVQQTALQAPPTQESIDLLTRLLQEFERRSYPSTPSLPPEVERGIDIVEATFESLTSALELAPNPIVVSSVSPSYGRATGGEPVTIRGSHFLPGVAVRFGDKSATSVSLINRGEIRATTPASTPGCVDVVVNTIAGSAALVGGFTYQS